MSAPGRRSKLLRGLSSVGLPGYNDWRAFCALPRVYSFSSMPDHTPELRAKFAQLYEHPDDIDLFTGAVTEK